MEDDEDDFYGGGTYDGGQGGDTMGKPDGNVIKDERMEDSDEQAEDEDEDEDSDDDVQFTLEKPEGAKAEPVPGSKTTRPQSTTSHERTISSDIKGIKPSTPIKLEHQRPGSTAPPPATTAFKGPPSHNGKEGKDFPETRRSKVDVNSIPAWPGNGKAITEVDIDADLAENSKPWRLPGTDQTDFFNYGFDEYTWAQYCVRQQMMGSTISEQKQADAQMKALFGGSSGQGGQSGGGGGGGGGGGSGGGGGGGGGGGIMPPGMPPMPSMPGMPSPDEMQQMMQQMMAQGMDLNDPNAMIQMMMSSGMPGMPGMPPNQQQGGGGGGYGGGSDSASPHPQGGQGFQPPQGPGGQNQQGDQGGFPPAGMEGYSPQQLAIMQQQGGMGGQGGGGGGRGRGRRGRGYY